MDSTYYIGPDPFVEMDLIWNSYSVLIDNSIIRDERCNTGLVYSVKRCGIQFTNEMETDDGSTPEPNVSFCARGTDEETLPELEVHFYLENYDDGSSRGVIQLASADAGLIGKREYLELKIW
jgi:hypothetical protein